MSMISETDRQVLRDLFAERMTEDVTMTYFGQRESVLIVPSHECAYCQETRELLSELEGLSDKLRLEVKDFVRDEAEASKLGVTHIPAVVLNGRNKGRVRYFGIPAGYEFSSLVEDLIDVSTGEPDLLASTREVLAGVTRDVHIQVFVTPT